MEMRRMKWKIKVANKEESDDKNIQKTTASKKEAQMLGLDNDTFTRLVFMIVKASNARGSIDVNELVSMFRLQDAKKLINENTRKLVVNTKKHMTTKIF